MGMKPMKLAAVLSYRQSSSSGADGESTKLRSSLGAFRHHFFLPAAESTHE
jgi:hypothetical protein